MNDDTDTTKETNIARLQLQSQPEIQTDKTTQDTHPYHPNDYWDRIRQHHHQLTPPLSLQSLPRHPPNIHIHITRKPSPLSSFSLTETDSRGRLADQYHAQDLRLRSRSPRFAPASNAPSVNSRGSTENQHDNTTMIENKENGNGNDHGSKEDTNMANPASQHSTFHGMNPRTSHMGDQELPWKLRIPGDIDEENEHEHKHSCSQPTPCANPTTDLTTVATTPAPPTATTPAITPKNFENNDNEAAIRTINESQSPVELPAPGQSGGKDEESSDEEVVMSSTAYPGQEWRPAGFSGWEY